MTEPISGIHHVTAIATDPQTNLDFYAGVLGLRLVKRTVNFDDPGTYHFYFGDELGQPGTILTFFPWPLARRGGRGSGQATVTSFSIPEGSLVYWKDRLQRLGVIAEEPEARFAEEAIAFYDPDGLKLELVEHRDSLEGGYWKGGPVPGQHAIRGVHGVTLVEQELDPTARLLTEVMGLEATEAAGSRSRFESGTPGAGRRIDVLHSPGEERGRIAAGTVHHVAWRVPDRATQADWRARLLDAGFHPTEVLDRQYFESIYFREPGGILFELATDPPGFTRDEEPADLGSALKLPPWLEPDRQRIERMLPTVELPELVEA